MSFILFNVPNMSFAFADMFFIFGIIFSVVITLIFSSEIVFGSKSFGSRKELPVEFSVIGVPYLLVSLVTGLNTVVIPSSVVLICKSPSTISLASFLGKP
jgi:hypothetical protein